MEYDDIIVGGGSSGAVLAARLSEDPAQRVLLLEAGPHFSSVKTTPPDLLNARSMSLVAHDWGLTAEAVPGRMIHFPRGKVTGGSSAVNATVALRGNPSDYDAWAAAGNREWSWDNVLPYFRKLEDDQDKSGALHGVRVAQSRFAAFAMTSSRRSSGRTSISAAASVTPRSTTTGSRRPRASARFR